MQRLYQISPRLRFLFPQSQNSNSTPSGSPFGSIFYLLFVLVFRLLFLLVSDSRSWPCPTIGHGARIFSTHIRRFLLFCAEYLTYSHSPALKHIFSLLCRRFLLNRTLHILEQRLCKFDVCAHKKLPCGVFAATLCPPSSYTVLS